MKSGLLLRCTSIIVPLMNSQLLCGYFLIILYMGLGILGCLVSFTFFHCFHCVWLFLFLLVPCMVSVGLPHV